jgi:hypothetical protein
MNVCRADALSRVLFGVAPHNVARVELNFLALAARAAELDPAIFKVVDEVVWMRLQR